MASAPTNERTFAYQDRLPRLPIPSLKHTADVYLRSLEPLLTKEELRRSKALVHDFFLKPGGLGEQLQGRLIAYDKTQKFSWIEKWWLEKVYLEWRVPLLVNSNWYILFMDDKNHPQELLTQNGGRLPRGHFGRFQLARTAHLINKALDYKFMIDTEKLPVDKFKTEPMDMDQYSKIFGVTRIPLETCDAVVHKFPSDSRHIVVLARDQVFSLDVFDKDCHRVPDGNIEQQLQIIVDQVQDPLKKKYAPVCVLTGDHRDEWTKARKHLGQISGTNVDTLKTIEDALFAISLDDYSVGSTPDEHVQNVLLNPDGHNRWFDKCVSIIVEANGKAGLNGEHAPCDALIPSFLAEYLLQDGTTLDATTKCINTEANMVPPRHLAFVVDAVIDRMLEQAQVRVSGIVADSDACVLHFDDYGVHFVKTRARLSPDAYMQMALQLGYYKLHRKCVATYETASVRKFLHGRTETTRTLSNESKKWVETMEDPTSSAATKYARLQDAVTAHTRYQAMAANGEGCDRHMFGLRMVMKPGESHDIFTDPAFSKSQKWELSTSGLSAGNYFNGTGFGTVYPDGYGVNYLTGKDILKFGIESKKSCSKTSSSKFRGAVVEALLDMKKVVVEATSEPAAKL